jgi:hypothetical protein
LHATVLHAVVERIKGVAHKVWRRSKDLPEWWRWANRARTRLVAVIVTDR